MNWVWRPNLFEMIISRSFYMMRHAESTDNAMGMISGAGSDPHLSEAGRLQAQATALLFESLPVIPEKIVVSGLRRTHQTAQLVAGHIEFIVDPDLNERHLGELDGKISETEQKLQAPLPGEESGIDHSKRVVAAVNRHLQDDVSTFFVCHGGTIRRIYEAMQIVQKPEIKNAVIYYFQPSVLGWVISVPVNG